MTPIISAIFLTRIANLLNRSDGALNDIPLSSQNRVWEGQHIGLTGIIGGVMHITG